MEPIRLFVFGAGYSANAAIDALDPRNIAVEATTRSPEKRDDLAARNIRAHIFDGTVPSPSVSQALESATHLLVSIAPDAAGDPALRQHRSDILKAPNLGWIGYYSTVGVYGDSNGDWIDETAPLNPLSPRNRYRVAAEADWRALASEKGVPLAILRLAGIYGPGRSAFDKLAQGKARRIVKPGQVFNRIHRDDIAQITARAAHARVSGVFNVCDEEPAPPQDLIAYAADKMGVTPPPEIPFEEADLSPMAKTFYAGNRRLSNAAIKSALDYDLLYPDYRAGLDAIWTQSGD